MGKNEESKKHRAHAYRQFELFLLKAVVSSELHVEGCIISLPIAGPKEVLAGDK